VTGKTGIPKWALWLLSGVAPRQRLTAARLGLSEWLMRLSRRQKQFIMMAADSLLSLITMWMAFSLRYEQLFVPFALHQIVIFTLGVGLSIPIFVRFGMYRAIFRYSGFGATVAIARAVSTYAVVFGICVLLLSFPNVPRTVSFIQPVIYAWAVLALRGLGGYLFVPGVVGLGADRQRERLLIFGAGASGIQTFGALHSGRDYEVVAFIDDDPGKQGRQIHGVTVISRAAAERRLNKEDVDSVLLAMPRLGRAGRNAIIDWLRPYAIHVRSIPSVEELATGRVSLSQVRDLDIEDLLGREPVPGDFERVREHVEGAVVMVTGAGGSIGSELCRQLLRVRPAALLLVEASEFALYAIHRELTGLAERSDLTIELYPLLCNVRDARRVEEICAAWRPSMIYHAAAYKHVPLVENNVGEGIDNNVIGTFNVARSALANGAARFVLISTDKAVRPTNVMGATKRFAEIVLQALAAEQEVAFEQRGAKYANGTIFSMVRFGNVLGSSGSVVPLFRSQIAAGGPVTVTHSEVTRYFMSIPEAAQLVLQAGAMAQGGEVFLLDMGEPVRIIDLARRMIELSGSTVRDGANPGGDIEIVVTGLRPGEKLYEELLIDDAALPTSHSRVMQARERKYPWSEIRAQLAEFRAAVGGNDVLRLRRLLSTYVDGFDAKGEIVDLIACEQGAESAEPPAAGGWG
jgi:FlaA1/EpsC-like NDP-sugar epimerase